MIKQAGPSLAAFFSLVVAFWVAAQLIGGGIGGAGGGGSSSGSAAATVNGNGVAGADGATTANLPVTGSNTNSATISAPAITTNTNGSYVISSIGSNNHGVPTEPSAPTQIIAPNQVNGYEIYAGYQVVATAGTLAARTGSQTGSNDTTGMSMALYPIPGRTQVFSGVSGEATATNSHTFVLGTTPTNGTLLISCVLGFSLNLDSNHTPTGTLISSFTALPAAQQPSGHQGQACRYRWANNEPGGGYTLTAPASSGYAAYVIAITNIAGFDMPLTSASANFLSSDASKDLCLAGGLDGTKQVCGEVGYVASSTKIYPTFVSAASLSSAFYVYCTDHTTVWTNLATNFAGGAVQLNGYDCANGDINGLGNTTILWKNFETVTLQGQGGGWPLGIGGGTSGAGSVLFDMTTTATTPFMQIGTTSTDAAQSGVTPFQISGVTFYGGVGSAQDGGGGDAALQIINKHQIKLYNNRFMNFANKGVHMFGYSAASGAPSDTSLGNIIMEGNWFTGNGGIGLDIECINLGGPIAIAQNIHQINNEFTNNLTYGEEFVDCGTNFSSYVWAFTTEGDVFQNNWLNNVGSCGGTCYEFFNNQSTFAGATMMNDYFENDEGGTANAVNQNGGNAGMSFGNNVYQIGIPAFLPTYNAATNAIQGCNAIIGHSIACATDSTACTAGTTYASGGSTLCSLQCNGVSAWKETGSTLGCY